MGNFLEGHSNITSESPINSSLRPLGVPYLKRLAHLDESLYQEFSVLWLALMVVNSLMFVVGMVLNSLALYVFCQRSSSWSTPAIYTINLAVADLLVALSLPARIALYHSGGDCVACFYVHTFSYFVNMYCSILFLTSICVDRYMAVVRSAGSRWRSPAVAKSVSVCIWLFAVVVTYSLQTSALEFNGASCCRVAVLFALTVLEFILPLLVIATFTIRVACALADSRLTAAEFGSACARRPDCSSPCCWCSPCASRRIMCVRPWCLIQLGAAREQHMLWPYPCNHHAQQSWTAAWIQWFTALWPKFPSALHCEEKQKKRFGEHPDWHQGKPEQQRCRYADSHRVQRRNADAHTLHTADQRHSRMKSTLHENL